MGAWGHLFDQNDDAADWLGEFVVAPAWSMVDEAFATIHVDYFEAPEASSALAAVEVVAAGLGKPSSRLDEAIVAWSRTHSAEAASRRQTAVAVATKVRDDSELNDLWQEADECADWKNAINETLSRL